MDDNISRIYENVAKTFTYIQKTLAQNSDEVMIDLKTCRSNRAKNYIVLTPEGLFIGRVEDCKFYGTSYLEAVNFTAKVNNLKWFIAYDRNVLIRYAERELEFLDRFIKNRVILEDMIIEGDFDPQIVSEINLSTGYKLVNGYKTLIMDFPILVENSIPVGRVVFVKDFSSVLKDILFTPVIFFSYTLILVVTLSSVLFFLFNRIVKDISFLRNMTYKFKEGDFSDIPKLNEMLRKTKSRDELFYLKRAILTMAQELESLINQLQSERDKLEELAYTDPLTGLNNRRFFLEEAKRMIEYAKRYKEPMSLIMLDIDNFKKINDEYGHDVGDIVLRELAEIIKKNTRSSDISARFGGEEFVILLPRTNEERAFLVAERIRQNFKRSKVQVDGREVETTVSIGVATLEEEDSIENLIKKADEALYEAKRSGKDKVVVFTDREEYQEQDLQEP